jgi:hypothetical protein
MSVIRVAPIESMARRALVKNLKNHNGNSLWAINNVPCLLSAAPPGTGLTCSKKCPEPIQIDLRIRPRVIRDLANGNVLAQGDARLCRG